MPFVAGLDDSKSSRQAGKTSSRFFNLFIARELEWRRFLLIMLYRTEKMIEYSPFESTVLFCYFSFENQLLVLLFSSLISISNVP